MQSSTRDSSVVHVVNSCPLPPLTVLRGWAAGLRRWCCHAMSKWKTRITSSPLVVVQRSLETITSGKKEYRKEIHLQVKRSSSKLNTDRQVNNGGGNGALLEDLGNLLSGSTAGLWWGAIIRMWGINRLNTVYGILWRIPCKGQLVAEPLSCQSWG